MFIDTHEILSFLTAEDFIGQSIAVLGIKGSGKSNTAAVLMEDLLTAGVPILVVDIAGEYHTLRDKFDQVTVIGRSVETEVQLVVTQSNARQIATTAYKNGRSVILDVSGMPTEARYGRPAALAHVALCIGSGQHCRATGPARWETGRR